MEGTLKSFHVNGRKIIGAILNYKDPNVPSMLPHPVWFFKSPTDYITEGKPIKIPRDYTVVEELELGVIIGRTCTKVAENEALDYIGGYCIGLDLTVTSELTKCRASGWPWATVKSFDTACPVGTFIPKIEIPDPNSVHLWCDVNGQRVQEGSTANLVFSIAKLISSISQTQTLELNDLILTGTPPIPAEIKAGDLIEGGIKGGPSIKFEVIDA